MNRRAAGALYVHVLRPESACAGSAPTSKLGAGVFTLFCRVSVDINRSVSRHLARETGSTLGNNLEIRTRIRVWNSSSCKFKEPCDGS